MNHWLEGYEEPDGPTKEEVERQRDVLADLLRAAYLVAGDAGADDLSADIEDTFYDLGLEL